MAGNVLIKNANGNTVTLQNPDTNVVDVVVDTSKIMQIIGNQTIDGIKTFTSSPNVPTLAAGDASPRIASTAFVQRALGSFAGGRVEAAARTSLPITDVGKFISLILAGNQTVSLPLLSSVTVGSSITIHNPTIFDKTITINGADRISPDGNQLTSVQLKQGEFITFTSESAVWRACGTGVLKYSGGFGASLNSNGYQKLPSGLIIQWGQINIIAANTAHTVTFPVAFTTSNTKVFTNLVNGGLSGSFYSWYTTPTSTQVSIIGASGSYCDWIAIGY